jgi:Protein of unknown function (DUF3261)
MRPRPQLTLLSALAAAALGWASCAAAQHPTEAADLRLRLSPASLGTELHLAQRLTLTRADGRWSFDTLLEADAEVVLVAALAAGQTVARLRWDGADLTEEHAGFVPGIVTADRILSDVQVAFWPVEAVRAGLPEGASVEEGPLVRTVSLHGRPWVRIRYQGTGPAWSVVELEQLVHGYHLRIDSREL